MVQRRGADESGLVAMQGGGHVPLVPAALSLLASFLSGITILGVPAEIYTHGPPLLHRRTGLGLEGGGRLAGGTMWLYMMSCNISLLFVALFILPLAFKLPTPSLYQYLVRPSRPHNPPGAGVSKIQEERFSSRWLLRLGAGLWMLYSMSYMAVVLYAPAIALSAVTGASVPALIASVGAVATIYTSIGTAPSLGQPYHRSPWECLKGGSTP